MSIETLENSPLGGLLSGAARDLITTAMNGYMNMSMGHGEQAKAQRESQTW